MESSGDELGNTIGESDVNSEVEGGLLGVVEKDLREKKVALEEKEVVDESEKEVVSEVEETVDRDEKDVEVDVVEGSEDGKAATPAEDNVELVEGSSRGGPPRCPPRLKKFPAFGEKDLSSEEESDGEDRASDDLDYLAAQIGEYLFGLGCGWGVVSFFNFFFFL